MSAALALPWGAMLLALVAGMAGGMAYFRLLRYSVDLLLQPGRRRLGLLLTLGRLAAAGLLLGLAVRQGAAPLLTAFAGFLAARWLSLRAAKTADPEVP